MADGPCRRQGPAARTSTSSSLHSTAAMLLLLLRLPRPTALSYWFRSLPDPYALLLLPVLALLHEVAGGCSGRKQVSSQPFAIAPKRPQNDNLGAFGQRKGERSKERFFRLRKSFSTRRGERTTDWRSRSSGEVEILAIEDQTELPSYRQGSPIAPRRRVQRKSAL